MYMYTHSYSSRPFDPRICHFTFMYPTHSHMSTTPSPLLHLCTHVRVCVYCTYHHSLPHPPPHTLTYQVVVKFLRKASVLKDCWVQDKEMGEVPLEISLLARLAHPNIVQVTYLLPVGQDWINILMQLEPLKCKCRRQNSVKCPD